MQAHELSMRSLNSQGSHFRWSRRKHAKTKTVSKECILGSVVMYQLLNSRHLLSLILQFNYKRRVSKSKLRKHCSLNGLLISKIEI